jgi:hypothetical protein
MEVPLVIAAAAFGLHKAMTSAPLEPSQRVEDNSLNVEDLWEYEAAVRGMPAPAYGASSTLLPYKKNGAAPFFVHQPGESTLDKPITNTHRQILNARYVDRVDFETAMNANLPQWHRKSAVPVYTGFTDELTVTTLSGERLSTGFVNFSWLPSQPTDSDYNDAAVMAKIVPPVPALFAPEADFATAPGVDWRYVDV